MIQEQFNLDIHFYGDWKFVVAHSVQLSLIWQTHRHAYLYTASLHVYICSWQPCTALFSKGYKLLEPAASFSSVRDFRVGRWWGLWLPKDKRHFNCIWWQLSNVLSLSRNWIASTNVSRIKVPDIIRLQLVTTSLSWEISPAIVLCIIVFLVYIICLRVIE